MPQSAAVTSPPGGAPLERTAAFPPPSEELLLQSLCLFFFFFFYIMPAGLAFTRVPEGKESLGGLLRARAARRCRGMTGNGIWGSHGIAPRFLQAPVDVCLYKYSSLIKSRHKLLCKSPCAVNNVRLITLPLSSLQTRQKQKGHVYTISCHGTLARHQNFVLAEFSFI